MKRDGDVQALSCPAHYATHNTSYGYMDEDTCQQKYNTELQFNQSVFTSHGIIHDGDEKPCKEGKVYTGTKHCVEVGRDYGAWNPAGAAGTASHFHAHKPLYPIPL